MIQDLRKILGLKGADVVCFGDGPSHLAAMQYVHMQEGGLLAAAEGHPALRP